MSKHDCLTAKEKCLDCQNFILGMLGYFVCEFGLTPAMLKTDDADKFLIGCTCFIPTSDKSPGARQILEARQHEDMKRQCEEKNAEREEARKAQASAEADVTEAGGDSSADTTH